MAPTGNHLSIRLILINVLFVLVFLRNAHNYKAAGAPRRVEKD